MIFDSYNLHLNDTLLYILFLLKYILNYNYEQEVEGSLVTTIWFWAINYNKII